MDDMKKLPELFEAAPAFLLLSACGFDCCIKRSPDPGFDLFEGIAGGCFKELSVVPVDRRHVIIVMCVGVAGFLLLVDPLQGKPGIAFAFRLQLFDGLLCLKGKHHAEGVDQYRVCEMR